MLWLVLVSPEPGVMVPEPEKLLIELLLRFFRRVVDDEVALGRVLEYGSGLAMDCSPRR